MCVPFLIPRIGKSARFKRLGAGQLLKHILGLAWTTKLSPRLMYVWYDSGCNEAGEHRDELARFRSAIDNVIEFTAQTYQDVFASLLKERESVRGYHAYLGSRCFAA